MMDCEPMSCVVELSVDKKKKQFHGISHKSLITAITYRQHYKHFIDSV